MSENNGNGGRFVGFLAFLVTMFAAVLYLVSFVLSFFNISDEIVNSMFRVATVIMICIVSVTGWRFVKKRSLPWKLVYILVLLAVVASVVIPVAVQFIPEK